jgi:hypothetical protein
VIPSFIRAIFFIIFIRDADYAFIRAIFFILSIRDADYAFIRAIFFILSIRDSDNKAPYSCPIHNAPPTLLLLAPVTEESTLYSSRHRRIPINPMATASLYCIKSSP